MDILKLKVTQIKSKNGRLNNHKECLNALGLRKLNQSVIVNYTPANIGLISKISYMLKVEEISNVS